VFKVIGHIAIVRVVGILLIDNTLHLFEYFGDLLVGNDAMVQPVSDVLTGYSQCRAILHQAQVVDSGYFRATDALVHPAHHIAEGALCVILQLVTNGFGAKVATVHQRHREDVFETCGLALGQLSLPLADIHLVIVHSVQGRCRR
jgi:hypothetical protein